MPVTKPHSIIFSIKPEFSDKIIGGIKTVELRRRFPSKTPSGTLAFIYSTSPCKAVIGFFEIKCVLELSVNQIWDDFSEQACIQREKFNEYFEGLENGYVIDLQNAKRLKKKFELEKLREYFNFVPPQSFSYATQEIEEKFIAAS